MKYILTLLALLGLSACTVTQPYIAEYRIETKKSTTVLSSLACKDKSLKVSQAFSENALMTQTMKYTQNDYGEYTFSESAWSQSPNKAITQEILKSTRDSELFKSVQSYKSRSASEYILESSIEEFIQHFSSDAKSSYVRIAISFSLVNSASSEVVDTLSINKTVPVSEMNAQGGVEAFNQGLGELLVEKNKWLNEVCR